MDFHQQIKRGKFISPVSLLVIYDLFSFTEHLLIWISSAQIQVTDKLKGRITCFIHWRQKLPRWFKHRDLVLDILFRQSFYWVQRDMWLLCGCMYSQAETAWSLYGLAASQHSDPGKGGVTASPAGAVPRNTIQSHSQETLFFRGALLLSLLPSGVRNSNLLLTCIRRIKFLLGTETVFLSKRRADGAKIPPIPFTERRARNLPCLLTL